MADKAPNYDAMDLGSDTGSDDAAAPTGSSDEEFLMHAAKAGFSGAKADALWSAIARCVELAEQNEDAGGEESEAPESEA